MKKQVITHVSTAIIFVLVRYFVKSSGSIVSLVRSLNEQGVSHDYTVTLNRNGQHTCSCEGNAVYHRQCKHIKHCRDIENTRAAQAKAAAVRATNELELERIVQEVEEQIARETAQAAAQPRKESEQKRIATLDYPLNGNRGFSMLKR